MPYPEVLLAFSIPFGLILGSFLNVCIFRIPRECMTIVKPRSRCIRCLKLVRWYENIPVFSWIFLRGKCAGCGAKISVRYPVVELLTTGLVFLVVWLRLIGRADPTIGPIDLGVLTVAQIYFMALLIAATFIDFDFRILPNEITYQGAIVGLVLSAAFPILHRHEPAIFTVIPNAYVASFLAAAVGAIVGAGVILVVRVVGGWIFKKEAMGQGDIYYMAFIGAFLGWQGVLLTFVIACLAGSVYGILHLIITRDRYLPFGPFLSLGAAFMLLFHPEVNDAIRWYMSLFQAQPG